MRLRSACTFADAERLRKGDPRIAAPPSEWLIDQIEDRLAEHPCVGTLKKWARFYVWHQSKDGVATSVVELIFRKPGFPFRLWSFVRARDASLKPGEVMAVGDDRDYLAFGSYHLSTGELKLDSCGRNRN